MRLDVLQDPALGRARTLTRLTLALALLAAGAQAQLERVYVSNWGSKTVSAYDTSSGALTGQVVLPDFPAGVVLDSPSSLLVASGLGASVLRVDVICETVDGTFASGGGLAQPRDMVVSPSGHLLVASRSTDEVLEYDADGAFLGVFASTSLDAPIGLAFGPGGDLHVTSLDADAVTVYDGTTGAFQGTFTAGGPLDGPTGLAFAQNGNLLVSSSLTHEVLEYDGSSGAFLGVFASGGGLADPIGLAFDGVGRLLVCSNDSDQVLAYDALTGVFLGVALATPSPWGLALGPAQGLPALPGFLTGVHAELEMPFILSFAPSGELFVGRQTEPVVGVPAFISRVASDGSVTSWGDTATLDPDAVLYDSSGLASGLAGSVIVAGICGPGVSCFHRIAPDETVTSILGPLGPPENPYKLELDGSGRAIVTDNSTSALYALDGSGVSVFAFLSEPATGLAIDGAGRVYSSSQAGTVSVHDAAGTLLDPAFAAGFGSAPPLAVGPAAAPWNGDLFALDVTSGELLRVDAAGSVSVVGTGFSDDQSDISFGPDGALYVSQVCSGRILRIAAAPNAFVDLGQGLAGTAGVTPLLLGFGALLGGDPVNLDMTQGLPLGQANLVIGVSALSAAFKGGVLVPHPDIVLGGLPLNGAGALAIGFTWPTGVPAGVSTWYQYWNPDPGGAVGFSASNALRGTTP